MYLRVATTPRVIPMPPPAPAASASSGLGFVPRLISRPGAPPVLQIPVPRFIFTAPNGLGQLTTCQYLVPGITPDPGVPICTAAQIAQQQAEFTANEYKVPAAPPGGGPAISGSNPGGPQAYTGPLAVPQPAPAATPAPAITPAPSSPTSTAPASGSTAAGSQPAGYVTTNYSTSPEYPVAVTGTATETAAGSASSLAFLSDTFFGIPVWVWGLGGLGLAWMLSRGGK